MRALVVSDIHGNMHALEAVIAAAWSSCVGGFDQLWNLGDAVGYGARPNEVLDRLRALAMGNAIHVRGNHDRVCCGLSNSRGFNPIAAESAAWTLLHLRAENREWLRALPVGPIRARERVMCVHGSPSHEDKYILSIGDAWTPLQLMDTEITFFGHTHVQGGFSRVEHGCMENRPVYQERGGSVMEQFRLKIPKGTEHLVRRYLINPGSVGQPRDGDWRAAFAIYDNSMEQVTFYRTPYDVAGAQAAIRETGLPERLAARLSRGR